MSRTMYRATARYSGWLALFVALLVLPGVVAAQTETGRITGTVASLPRIRRNVP